MVLVGITKRKKTLQNMSEQTTAVSVSKPNLSTVKGLLEAPQFRDQIARALPKHMTADRFLRIAITASLRTPRLLECTPTSLTNCLLQLSQLGLEPDGRRAHLIPFKNNKTNTVECTLIVDYKGLSELAMRSGLISNIHADVVRENDEFDYDRGQITKHKINFKVDRGSAYAFYCICRFKDGSEKCDVMSVDEVESIRLRSKSPNDGPWKSDPTEMAKKTVFRRLSKWLPMSPEFRDALDVEEDSVINVTGTGLVPELEGPTKRVGRPPGTPNKPKATEAPPEPTPTPAELPIDALTPEQEALYKAVMAAGGNWDLFQKSAIVEEWDGKAELWTVFSDVPSKLAVGLAALPNLKENLDNRR